MSEKANTTHIAILLGGYGVTANIMSKRVRGEGFSISSSDQHAALTGKPSGTQRHLHPSRYSRSQGKDCILGKCM